MLKVYNKHVAERTAEQLPPKPLDAATTAELVELLKAPPVGQGAALLDLLATRVPPGVDEAAYVKAAFLADIANGKSSSPLIDRNAAIALLGGMAGGYNITPLVALLNDDDEALSAAAAEQLKGTLLVFEAFHDIAERSRAGCAAATGVIESWAAGEWFLRRPEVPRQLRVVVFKVNGETNTDDLSPAQEAWSRPDIPLHAKAMYQVTHPGARQEIATLRERGLPVAFVGDVVGTGSSRKSAVNSVVWHIGEDIPWVPNKRRGGVCIGGKIAPIFFNTLEDAGALPIECDVQAIDSGAVIDILPYDGELRSESGDVLSRFALRSPVLLDEVRAGGRIELILGRNLSNRARETLDQGPSELFRKPPQPPARAAGYTLAQKMVGRACGVDGVSPGSYCEPRVTTVGSQDTTGPMTRSELKDLACVGFSSDLVMQSFCHTVAYPKPVDIETQHTLPEFIRTRGGVSLRPGDGIIHSWLNRMLLPDTIGTGGDSHTRFPIGMSFPAGSGLVAFAATAGVMPLDMPESVLVRFRGEVQPGITLRDLVHAIPYAAIQQGLLTLAKRGKKNVFSGRILEIEGLPQLKIEQAFEFSDASAERSAASCTVLLDEAPVVEYLRSNVTLLRSMIGEGYGDARTLERRARKMEQWLEQPTLLRADADAEYAAVIDIDIGQIDEPLLACPNDPDNVQPLSAVQGDKVDEIFIGSCMTNIGHYRAAAQVLAKREDGELPTRLWIAPPTRMDQQQLIHEGHYAVFGRVGARTEVPGCSLCMGNQARVRDGATVVSTSTRNFPNRMGREANVYLASAELSAVTAMLGQLPSVAQYREHVATLPLSPGDPGHDELYRYLNFDQMSDFRAGAERAGTQLEALNIEAAPVSA